MQIQKLNDTHAKRGLNFLEKDAAMLRPMGNSAYGWAGAGLAAGLLKSKFTLGAWRAPSSVLK